MGVLLTREIFGVGCMKTEAKRWPGQLRKSIFVQELNRGLNRPC